MARKPKMSRYDKRRAIVKRLAHVRWWAHAQVPEGYDVFKQCEIHDAINKTLTEAQTRVFRG